MGVERPLRVHRRGHGLWLGMSMREHRPEPQSDSTAGEHAMSGRHDAVAGEGWVWFVTGTSSGFRRELIRAVVAHGDRVVATPGMS